MSSSTLFDYAAVYSLLARFIGWPQWLRPEPRLSTDVERVICDAYHRIDEQATQLKLQAFKLDLQEIEIELLQSELKWLSSVLKEARIVLSDYDYMRLQQVAIKVRAMRGSR